MGVHRQVVRSEWTSILEEVAGHPMIFSRRGEVFYLLAELAAQDLGAAFTRGTDEGDGQAGLIGHGDECGFAIARQAFYANLFRVDRPIRFKIVQRTACAPSPRAQGAPVI